MDKAILHCDLNCFYASVELLFRPELKNFPVAICGNPKERQGIILAKNEKAKLCGVSTGEPIWQSIKKCPDLKLFPPRYEEYLKYSKMVRDIYYTFTPNVESFGSDECWLDVTGCEKLFGTPVQIAEKISEKVKALTGLTLSIGVSFTKVFAKLGSDMKKPDAITVLTRENFKEKIYSLSVSELLYVGNSTSIKLKECNINTIGDLANISLDYLISKFGKLGLKLHHFANGIEDDSVSSYIDFIKPKSVGNGVTLPVDIENFDQAKSVLYALSEVIAFRLRKFDLKGKSISIDVRNSNLSIKTKSGQLISYTNNSQIIAEKAYALLISCYDFKVNIRTLTIRISGFIGNEEFQPSFFEEENNKLKNLDITIDNLRKKYGYQILKRCINMGTVFVCDTREIDDDFISFH